MHGFMLEFSLDGLFSQKKKSVLSAKSVFSYFTITSVCPVLVSLTNG
jgi:hypothetical protein